MRKGQQTRLAIVEAALEQASSTGLEGLTIGALAERMKMSKSGVFAHFGSREDLQIAVLEAYEARFIEQVLKEAVRAPRGLPRLMTLFDRWLEQTLIEANRGCIWIAGASEYDDRPGAVRDELVRMVERWRAEMGRAVQQAVAAGHLMADTDVDELMFGVNGAILVLHHDVRLLRNPRAPERARRAIDRLLDPLRTPQAPAISLASLSQPVGLATPIAAARSVPPLADLTSPLSLSQGSVARPGSETVGAGPSASARSPAVPAGSAAGLVTDQTPERRSSYGSGSTGLPSPTSRPGLSAH